MRPRYSNHPCPLFWLPAELRERIYEYLLTRNERFSAHPAILATSQEVFVDALPTYRRQNPGIIYMGGERMGIVRNWVESSAGAESPGMTNFFWTNFFWTGSE